ncbi:MAG: adenylosuccinate lyase [Candidatus Magasanikbacteria bacterium CG_4_10_14_0_2_um_filter_37_12]|uniref:Adenylosuccinate lyase n=1 Tax=Candidatus Magasanikbacteria bacterium CG_4_10_14_0_2_um_filter_37_12 TaxID=1974637 RepID=A0A2M7V956_9BACT|nr:MAG: adenylosuccinate lyase [Candidatus Magasanikbacteria bacterium CG_4_10_14_0_2_um_filter_37_12]
MNQLYSISPIDGRYYDKLSELSSYFSEMALIRYRLVIEVEYLIDLSLLPETKEIPAISSETQEALRIIYRNFSEQDARKIKEIEQTTNHDLKAVEYFLKKKLQELNLSQYTEFIHFALTSEDANNLAYSLMWYDAFSEIYRPLILDVYKQLKQLAEENKNIPMLSLTHGQSATPSTVGKEFAVFAHRLNRQIEQIKNQKFLGKFGGATGTWAAHQIAYPEVDWILFSKKFISKFGLDPNLITIQIEPHDSLAESYHNIIRINNILIDFCRDIWSYVSRGILDQKRKEGEVGSSTMPHKINPIQFENAEGNLGIANAYLDHLANKLPISRMQRDLTDSTVLRNQGVPLAHSVLAYKNILNGLSRLTVNREKLEKELNDHPEVLAEAIQTIMRKVGIEKPYEKLKKLTQGEEMTLEKIREFVSNLDLPEDENNKLRNLTPETYTGLAGKLTSLI